MTRLIAVIVRVIPIFFMAILLGVVFIWHFTETDKSARNFNELQAKYTALEKEFSEADGKIKSVEADRDNVLAQTKRLLFERSELMEKKEAYDRLEVSNKKMNSQIRAIHENLKRNAAKLLEYELTIDKLKQDYNDLAEKYREIQKKDSDAKSAINASLKTNAQYIKVQAGFEAAQKASEKRMVELVKYQELQRREISMARQVREYQKNVKDLTTKNQQLNQRNAQLERDILDLPVRLKDMADENKKMIRETAEMHYNLGVFYTEQRNFKMATQELERALEFDPLNAKCHYNLGYLYAEQYSKHEQAMMHFKRYLEIEPNSKEANAVREYILDRETYGIKPATAKGSEAIYRGSR